MANKEMKYLKEHPEIFDKNKDVYLELDEIPLEPNAKQAHKNNKLLKIAVPLAAGVFGIILFFGIPFSGTTMADSVFESITKDHSDGTSVGYGQGVSMQVRDDGTSEGTANSIEEAANEFNTPLLGSHEYDIIGSVDVSTMDMVVLISANYDVNGTTVNVNNMIMDSEIGAGAQNQYDDSEDRILASSKDGIEITGFAENGVTYAYCCFKNVEVNITAENTDKNSFIDFLESCSMIN